MINRNTLLVEAHRFLVDMDSNPQRYIDFLSTMAKYHKYDLMQQINLFFHASADNTAVAPRETWEKLGHPLKQDAAPILLLKGERNRETIETVFDVSDTVDYRPDHKLLWQFDAKKAEDYMDEHFPGPGTIPERIIRHCEILAENTSPDESRQKFVALSTAYIVLERMGYDANESAGFQIAMQPWQDIHAKDILEITNRLAKHILNPLGEHIRKAEREEKEHDFTGRTVDADDLANGRTEETLGRGRSRGSSADGGGNRVFGESSGRPVGERKETFPDNDQSKILEGSSGRGSREVSGGSAGTLSGTVSEPVGTAAEEGRADDGITADGLDEVRGTEPADRKNREGNHSAGNSAVNSDESQEPIDYTATMTTTTGKRKVFARNLAAIRRMKKLECENLPPTEEDIRLFKSYAGFGGLPEVFDKNYSAWHKEYTELRTLLSEAEFSAARASTLNAHYTPNKLIQSIYNGLEQMGFKSGNILELSAGSGRFFDAHSCAGNRARECPDWI